MHYFIDVLKKYAVFSGRARRAEYWYFTLFSGIVSIIINIISSYIIKDAYNVIGIVYALALLVPSLAVSVRRLHDVGKSGWMMLIIFIPIVGAIWLLVLDCTDSNPGDNKYGPNPKMATSSTPMDNPMPPTPPQYEQPPVNPQ